MIDGEVVVVEPADAAVPAAGRAHALSAEADELWISGDDNGLLRFELPEFREAGTAGTTGESWALAISDDGSLVVWGTSDTVGVVNRKGNEIVQWSVGTGEHGLAFVGSAPWIVFLSAAGGSAVGELWSWAEGDREPRRVSAQPRGGSRLGFAHARDSVYFYAPGAGVTELALATGETRVIDATTREIPPVLLASSNGRYLAERALAASGPAPAVRIFDLATGEVATGPEGNPVGFDPRSGLLLASVIDGGADLVDPIQPPCPRAVRQVG